MTDPQKPVPWADETVQIKSRPGGILFTTEISLGAIIQAVTVIGSVTTAIFTAGGYVQHLRDTLAKTGQQQVQLTDQVKAIVHEQIAIQAAANQAIQQAAAATSQAATATGAAATAAGAAAQAVQAGVKAPASRGEMMLRDKPPGQP